MHHFDELNNVLTTPDGTPNVGAVGRAPLRTAPISRQSIPFYIPPGMRSGARAVSKAERVGTGGVVPPGADGQGGVGEVDAGYP